MRGNIVILKLKVVIKGYLLCMWDSLAFGVSSNNTQDIRSGKIFASGPTATPLYLAVFSIFPYMVNVLAGH